MKIIGKKTLEEFKTAHADARPHLSAWENEVATATWKNHHELKSKYPKASILQGNEVIFNIRNNYYRLQTKIDYVNQIVLVKKIGSHKEYMNW